MSETEDMKKKILKIMRETGLDFDRAKMRYKIELTEKLRETERETDAQIKQFAENLASEALSMLDGQIGDEFEIEAKWSDDFKEITFTFTKKTLDGFDELKGKLSEILALEETKHLTLEIFKTEDGKFEVKFINRAE
jgi:hypothetical protein